MQILSLSFAVSLLVTLLLTPLASPLLRKLKLGQSIREEGPESHRRKAGTPTMGGLLILLGMAAGIGLTGAIAYSVRSDLEYFLVLIVAVGFGLIGFWDDYLKVARKRSMGLRAREKLFGQGLIAAGLAFWVVRYSERGTALTLPFTNWSGDGGISVDLGWFPFVVFAVLLTVGFANAVNLTDGLDGLASGTSFFAALGLAAVALLAGKYGIAISMAAMAGGCLGFLYFNRHPAKLFMGDTGALALGGGLAAAGILSGGELTLLLIGGVFIGETLSVIIQVISFQTTGKRVFRMTPLHHHFELGGWSENKVVGVFCVAALLFLVLGLAGQRL